MSRILLLVDYPPLGRALAFTLRRAGYQVELACSTTDILLAVTQHTCDVLLLDMTQANSTRWRLLQAIHRTPQAVPLVALLEPEDPRWQSIAACAACLPLLTHLVRKQTLLGCLHTALDTPGPHHARPPTAPDA